MLCSPRDLAESLRINFPRRKVNGTLLASAVTCIMGGVYDQNPAQFGIDAPFDMISTAVLPIKLMAQS